MEKIPLNRNYALKAALMIYQAGDEEQFYIEHHGVSAASGTPVLGVGRPLAREQAVSLFKATLVEEESRLSEGLLPETLLDFDVRPGTERISWWEPRQLRHLSFVESLGIPDGVLETPPLLFVQKNNGLSVFTLPHERRPRPEDELLWAPFHNVNTSGSVCLGSAAINRRQRATLSGWMAEWSKGFWTSRFSALHNSEILREGNINAYLTELIAAEGKTPFDTSRLKPAGLTVLKATKH